MRSFISQLGFIKRTSERLSRERVAREARDREAVIRERDETIKACTTSQSFEEDFVITEEGDEVVIHPAKEAPEKQKQKKAPLDPKAFRTLVFGDEKFEDVEF